MHPVNCAFRLSIPVGLAYFPFGFAFGLLFQESGYAWFYAPIMSLFVYAGAIQYVAIVLLKSAPSLIALFFATFPLALRNSFYGLSLLDRFSYTPFVKGYMALGLVDSTYAILYNCRERYEGAKDRLFCLSLTIFNHFYWVIGTFFGAFMGKNLGVIRGMEFMLTALTFQLAIELLESRKSWKPVIFSLIGLSVAFIFTPSFLLGGALAVCATLVIIDSSPERGTV